MTINLLSNVGREIAQWRQYFRTHGAAALRTPFRRSHADTDLDTTDWPETEWSETSPDTLALSGPIDPTETRR